MSDTKVCSKCKEEKPRSEFHKKREAKDGLQSQCKNCRNQCRKQYDKQYYQENKEKIKQYYQENREKLLDYFKQHYKENKEKYVEKRAKRRALTKDAIPEALIDCSVEKERLLQIYKLRDLLTKATGVEYHIDHIWPLAKGGPHWSGNLQVITAEENLSKHASFCEDTARVIQESLNENTCS